MKGSFMPDNTNELKFFFLYKYIRMLYCIFSILWCFYLLVINSDAARTSTPEHTHKFKDFHHRETGTEKRLAVIEKSLT